MFWPEPYRAAVSLTFDDGMHSHLHKAVPLLEQHGLRGTFYVNPRGAEESAGLGDSWMEQLVPWQAVQARGHEIGNHTLVHPCSLNIQLEWNRPHNLLYWTLDQVQADILAAQRRLDAAFPNQRENTFAYPCYESTVGRGRRRVSYTPYIAEHFVAGRHKGELLGDHANDPQHCDIHHLSSWAVERQPGALMVGLVEQAAALGRWMVFTFHGIDEGHLLVGAGDFTQLVGYLAGRKDIWTAPLVEVGKYVRDHNPIP
jgi:peptidoglycan/xylan/chitin deacetylase (PgdA/CDA1 family)